MPRYYFHVRDHNGIELDEEGAEFATPELAHQEAIQSAREMIAELVLTGETVDGRRFEITAEDGTIVSTLLFRSVLKLD